MSYDMALFFSCIFLRDVHCSCNVFHEELKLRKEGSCLVLQPLGDRGRFLFEAFIL